MDPIPLHFKIGTTSKAHTAALSVTLSAIATNVESLALTNTVAYSQPDQTYHWCMVKRLEDAKHFPAVH